MTIQTCTNPPRRFRHRQHQAFRILLFAATLAGLPAFAQPAPAHVPPVQALPPLQTPAEFLATVRSHPDVIITKAAYEEAVAHTVAAMLAHGDGSPQVAEAEEILALRRGWWINAVVTSYEQQMDHLRNQGYSALAVHDAFGNLNLFGAN